MIEDNIETNLLDLEGDKVESKVLETVMRDSYLKYAMSVIVSRALPDVRDGMKPVHRRIIYVMNKMGLTPGSKFRKSAQVVGEVMGKYHPHGDASVYDAMVRLAQPFSLRYPLVDGQGNFGSVDGDNAAAMRYTEARMHKHASSLVQDIEKDTVDFVDNYDGSFREPKVLPNLLPNLLINGTTGIAVGMATSIPPHNLKEVCDAVCHLLYNPDATILDLMQYIKGPDFPTGCTLYGHQDLVNAYTTGKGKASVRATATFSESQIIITEIPYMVNKSTLVEKMADLVKEKIIEGVKDLRDESNKQGIRIVVDVKRDASPEIILNQFFKSTDLQCKTYFNLLALVNDGRQPKLLNLKEILVEFINHRYQIVTRRTNFDLKKASAEIHILDGIKVALDNIDKVVALIRSSKDKEEASTKLQEAFSLSQKQAEAILGMRLQTLTTMDKNKIEEKRRALQIEIDALQSLLDNPGQMQALIKDEITELSDKFNSPRQTPVIEMALENYNKENFVVDEEVLIQLTKAQYLKVLPTDTFREQNRGGKGVKGLDTKDDDYVHTSMVASSHDYVYAFTNTGRIFKSRVFDLPQGSRTGRGQNLVNYFNLQDGEKITNILTVSKAHEENSEGSLVFLTKNGTVKRTLMNEYAKVRQSGLIAINIKDEDKLVEVAYSHEETDKVIISADNGRTVIFTLNELRPLGRATSGVRGINLGIKDSAIALQLVQFEFPKDEETEEKIKVE